MSHCDSPKSLQGHWGGWRSGHLFTLGCSFCVLRPCAGKEERSHTPPVVSSSESRDCCIQGPPRPTFLQGSSGAALPCSTSHSQAHTFFMHTGATTTDTRRKQRVENTSPERQSRPCSIWEVLGQRSCSNLNVLLDADGSIAASSTVTAHHGAQAAATAARKKIASLPLAQARSFETQELWHQGTPIPSCQPYRKFSPQQCPQREPCSPWPLWLTAPGWALSHLQASSQLGLWALFCRFCRRGQAGNRELLKQQDLLQPTHRTLEDCKSYATPAGICHWKSKRPCHTCTEFAIREAIGQCHISRNLPV